MASSPFDFRTLGKRVLPFRAKRALRSVAFNMLDLRWQLPTNVDIRIRSQSDWAIYNEIFASGDYDPAILLALEAAKPDDELCILDLGANVGFFALRCVDLARRQRSQVRLRITAIEGNPRICRQLRARLSGQHEMPPYTVVNGLVGARSGSAAISDLEFSGQNQVAGNSAAQFQVDYVDVERVLDVPRIGLLKCDIEGSELTFLQNYPDLLRRTDVAVLELHPFLCDEKECLALLTTAGLVKQIVLAEKSGSTKVVMASR